jgi:hypothetical protein
MTNGEVITGSVDRSRVWEFAGVSLDRNMVSESARVDSGAEWVEKLWVSGVGLLAIGRSDAS